MNEPIDNAAWRTWEPPKEGEAMTFWQNGRCAMCGVTEQLVKDHCHKTGLVRGNLCKSCNTGEGFAQTDEWVTWRNWDNPARAYGWVEVYEGRGGTPISPSAQMTYMSESERETWWQEQREAAAHGRDWPTVIVLSESGKQREAQFQKDLDYIAWVVAQ